VPEFNVPEICAFVAVNVVDWAFIRLAILNVKNIAKTNLNKVSELKVA